MSIATCTAQLQSVNRLSIQLENPENDQEIQIDLENYKNSTSEKDKYTAKAYFAGKQFKQLFHNQDFDSNELLKSVQESTIKVKELHNDSILFTFGGENNELYEIKLQQQGKAPKNISSNRKQSQISEDFLATEKGLPRRNTVTSPEIKQVQLENEQISHQQEIQQILNQKDQQISKLQDLVQEQQNIIKAKDEEIDKLREEIYRLALDEQETPTTGQRGYSRRDLFEFTLGSPLISDFHRQLEIIRKERKYYVFTEADTYKQQVISSLNHLKKCYKELLQEACRSLSTSWKNIIISDPISIADAIEMMCTMGVITAAKTGSEKQVSTEDFLRIRDSFLLAIEEQSQRVQDFNQVDIDPQVIESYRKKYGIDQSMASAMFTKYLQILVTQLFYVIDLR